MKNSLNSALGFDRDPKTLDTLAEFINSTSDTAAKELVRLRELCMGYYQSPSPELWMPLQRFLNNYPIRLRVDTHEGQPFFNYMSARPAERFPLTPESSGSNLTSEGLSSYIYIADAKLPSMVVHMLQKMQDGTLHLLRKCEYCGLWMHARGKNVRWCPSPRRCKNSFFEKTDAGREASRLRQRAHYKATKERDERSLSIAKRDATE